MCKKVSNDVCKLVAFIKVIKAYTHTNAFGFLRFFPLHFYLSQIKNYM